MLTSLLLALALLAPQVPAQTPATPPAPTEGAKEDPAVTALARKIYSQIRAGKIDETLLTPDMNKALGPDVLAQYKPVFELLGEPTRLTLESSNKLPAGTQWVYLAAFATAQLHVKIYVTTDGKVGGYMLAP